jgi:hypothetical protein
MRNRVSVSERYMVRDQHLQGAFDPIHAGMFIPVLFRVYHNSSVTPYAGSVNVL